MHQIVPVSSREYNSIFRFPWNRFTETFNVRLYAVINDDPYFGKVGAEADIGEIDWQTWGTVGTPGYKTNGRRLMWKNEDGPMVPTDLLDASNVSFRSPGFSGKVSYITYASNILTGGRIGAYFVSFTGRVTVYRNSPDYMLPRIQFRCESLLQSKSLILAM
jgi:hypothetical protein